MHGLHPSAGGYLRLLVAGRYPKATLRLRAFPMGKRKSETCVFAGKS